MPKSKSEEDDEKGHKVTFILLLHNCVVMRFSYTWVDTRSFPFSFDVLTVALYPCSCIFVLMPLGRRAKCNIGESFANAYMLEVIHMNTKKDYFSELCKWYKVSCHSHLNSSWLISTQ